MISVVFIGESHYRVEYLGIGEALTTFKPRGVCSRQIDFEIDADGIVHNIRFTKGCPGNTAGLAKLAEGQSAEFLINLLKGVPCGDKSTSCPDQLALALEAELSSRL